MLAACREGAEEAREDRAKLVAITVLTSMNQDALSEIGVESPVAEEAVRLAKLAQANGIDGIVCSPMEAHDMRELLGPDALIVTPGVRPMGAALGDQSRVATPSRLSSVVQATLWWAVPLPVPTIRLPPLTLLLPSWSKTSPKRFPQVTTFGYH